jgi:hypothetical protein
VKKKWEAGCEQSVLPDFFVDEKIDHHLAENVLPELARHARVHHLVQNYATSLDLPVLFEPFLPGYGNQALLRGIKAVSS